VEKIFCRLGAMVAFHFPLAAKDFDVLTPTADSVAAK
jgi:hypothetical protein